MDEHEAVTEKLYYAQPYLREFQATVQTIRENGDATWAAVLDRTAFYPEGGGQPADHGELGGQRVLDVHEHAGVIVHVLAGPPAAGNIRGMVDWQRRTDHMQQHSGEHVLLGAFFRLFAANSCGFGIGEAESHIDLDNADLTAAQIYQAEDLANQVVWENRAVTCRWLRSGEPWPAAARKKPARAFAALRMVTVADFDICPCGGTHVSHTGEIGLVKILRWEHKKKGLRLYYVAGQRALQEFRRQNAALHEVATHLSAPPSAVTEAVLHLQDKAAQQTREIHALRQEACRLLARQLLAEAAGDGAVRVVRHILGGADVAQVPELAASLAAHAGVVALVAGWDQAAGRGQLAFARAADVSADMRVPLKSALAALHGKGGGTAASARGVFSQAGDLPAALAAAAATLPSGQDTGATVTGQ